MSAGPPPAASFQGNLIGTQADGLSPLGNSWGGIVLPAGITQIVIGGVAPGEANVIAFNGNSTDPGSGVMVDGTFGNTIRGNSIHDNSGLYGLGIDLGSNGVTPNDPGDADAGPNGYQNFPLIGSVNYGASNTTIQGKLNSTASTTFDLDFYANPICQRHPHDFLEGETYIGSTQVTTDGSGNATFNVVFSVALELGQPISATATSPDGSTSEFSQRILFSVTPASGPPAGGATVALAGMAFEAGATVTFGATPASNVVVTSDTAISVQAPALPAGSLSDVSVQNLDGTNGTLMKGWVADFLDVPAANPFYSFVTTLVTNAITVGVGQGDYGVDQPTLRQQMAVFLLKARHGVCYTPRPCTPGVFADVACPSTFASWIEQLAAEGITGGCGGDDYCPGNPVRRDQMAVFLLKTEHGSDYLPPACVPPGVFPDVPCPGTFTSWIEQLAAESITGGCGGGNDCPNNPNTRGQMAVFIVKTFGLQ